MNYKSPHEGGSTVLIVIDKTTTPFLIHNCHWSHQYFERPNQIHEMSVLIRKISHEINIKSKQNRKKSNQIRTPPNQIYKT